MVTLLRVKRTMKFNGFCANALVGLAGNWWWEYTWRKSQPRLQCASTLLSLGRAMMICANENEDGRFPAADKWCDLLLEGHYANDRQFVCRAARDSGDNKRCHYAINPNCKPNSPGDVVMLFETKGGWNQVGGQEILTTDNHAGKGCNILFNNGRVEFVKTEDLGKLKWKVEEDN